MDLKNLTFLLSLFTALTVQAQQVLETGPNKMPDEWIDKDTGHKIIRLSRLPGNSSSFYFHNNPFIKTPEGDKMVFWNGGPEGYQAFTVNLKTFKTEQLTHLKNSNDPAVFDRERNGHNGEALGPKSHNLYYQLHDSVFATNANTKKTKLCYVMPADCKGYIFSLNADETLLVGLYSPEADEIAKKFPDGAGNKVYDAHVPHTIFTVNLATKELKKLRTENNYLNHIQFSPTQPNLLMFCHEGPWQSVDRIWTLDVKTGVVKLMHKRTMTNEIAGHEWFSPDGKRIWFDLQVPRSTNFYVAGSSVADQNELRYQLTRDQWSIHFNISADEKLFAGEGGNEQQVAAAKDGQWVYLFRPNGDRFDAEKLVNMKNHTYTKAPPGSRTGGLEPNVHFSPDGKWVIVRANFEGTRQVYAAEVAKAKM